MPRKAPGACICRHPGSIPPRKGAAREPRPRRAAGRSQAPVNILAIETSCDETSVAIVRDGREVLANIIASQIGLHQRFGGVVPELASRQHIVTLIPTLEEAMRHAGLDWDGIDAIAVTCGPGLAGALLVGLNAAKAIAFARNKPLIAVNHLEAHIYSNWIIPETLDREGPPSPREPRPAAEQTRAGAALRAL